MKLWLALLLFALEPTTALAETVRVRSGEHGAFTRLVLEFEQLPAWRAGRTDNGYALDFPDAKNLSFDTSEAFRIIDRNRIHAVDPAPSGDRVDIPLACVCWASVTEFRGNALIVDIYDGSPGPEARHETSLDPSGPPEVEDDPIIESNNTARDPTNWHPSEWSRIPSIDHDHDLDLVVPLASALPKRARMPDAFPGVSGHEKPFHRAAPSALFPSIPQDAFNGPFAELPLPKTESFAVDMLSRELSRAVAQGLVDAPDMSSPLSVPRPALSHDQRALEEGRGNLTITTAIDRDIGAIRSRPGPTSSGAVCLPDSEVDLPAWGDPNNRDLLGRLRSVAVEEDGTVSGEGALALARYYLAMGFGAEARRTAELVPDERRRSILQTMAEIIDYGESDAEVLSGQVYCEGKIALWSMLAKPLAMRDRPSNTDDILYAFSELPLPIRIHLGPVLSERLRATGYDEEAQMALNAVTRGGGHTAAQDLTAARLGLSGTAAETARAELARLARGTDMIAAEALLELLLDAERRGIAPEPEWVDDAPSLVRATQGTNTAADLNLAGFRGRIALGDFDVLREALNEWSPGLTDNVRRDLAATALVAAGEMADDAMFLRSELGFKKIADPGAMTREDRFHVSERLLNLGLAERAYAYSATKPSTDEERRIAASVLVGLDRYEEAAAMLSRPESPELLTDLGMVLLKSGRASEAVQAFAQASSTEAASEAAIQDGDWKWLEKNADEALSEATGALRVLTEAGTDVNSPGNADLLDQASKRRQQAAFLLHRTRLDRDPAAFTN